MPLPVYTTPTVPVVTPLNSGLVVEGGILELYERQQPSGEMIRLAFVNDLTAGLILKTSLTSLTSVDVVIPWNRFVAGQGLTLKELEQDWESAGATAPGPFLKRDLLTDDTYLFYTQPPSDDYPNGRQYRTRIAFIDRDDLENLSATAICAAVELSDYLTQYFAGRSQFSGLAPSLIASHILAGDQSIALENRRFTRDTPVRMDLAREIPDMTPRTALETLPSGVVSPPTDLAED